MVFAHFNLIDKDMSSIGTNGSGAAPVGTNANLNVPRPASSNRPVPSPTPAASLATNNNFSLPSYDVNDMQVLLRTLIRCIMRTFYEMPKSLVVEYIFHHDRIKLEDLAHRLCVDTKIARSYITEFRRDKFIVEKLRVESNEGTAGPRNQDRYYYEFDAPTFINIVKYRLHNLRLQVEKGVRNPRYQGSYYKCEPCSIEYDEFAVLKLLDPQENTFTCPTCGGLVEEDAQNNDETANSNRQVVNIVLFNEQMKSIYELLDHIEKITNHDQQMNQALNTDGTMTNGGYAGMNSSHPSTRDQSTAQHRSQAANIFDRTRTLNHNIEIVIEKDEDDPYAQVDADETSNVEASISSSRGPGKVAKKLTKAAQSSGADGTNSSGANQTKSSTKKVPYEPKPMPVWFLHSTVYQEADDEHLSNSSNANASSLSRQLSNAKLNKSTTIHDIKQMLLMHESHRKKTSLFPTMEDSLSPPTPQQMTRLNTSQSTSSLPQFPTNSGVTVATANNAMDEDDAAMSLFHLINEDSVHHMDIDKND